MCPRRGGLPREKGWRWWVPARPAQCAYFLALFGHEVDVYDAHPAPGGMLRYGIPSYRLRMPLSMPRSKRSRAWACISTMARLWGAIFTADLRSSHDAVFLAWERRKAPHDGARRGFARRAAAVDFLGAVARGENVRVGTRVMVVGGGNSAIDAARTLCVWD
jgi:formate dehydrogenase major subunit